MKTNTTTQTDKRAMRSSVTFVLGACGAQEVAVAVVAIQVLVVVEAAALYNNDPLCLHVW